MNEFRTFYIENKDKLFAYLMRLTGDYYLSGDLMQESFTRYLDRYGQEEQNVALLFTIARNAFFDTARKQVRNTRFHGEQKDSSHNPENALMVREEYREVLSAMKKLDNSARDLLALVASGTLSYREIASIAGIGESNLKVKIHRARIRLKKILGKGDP